MDDSLTKPLTKKDSKLLRNYYGRMIRDIGVGVAVGIIVLFIKTTNWFTLGVLLSLGLFALAIGEMMIHYDDLKRK